MTHRLAKAAQAQDLSFCPYEDVLAVGHSMGLSSLLVPGSGEPNFDTFVANPFETVKQRREAEVHSLLDKLPSELIVLDPTQVGAVQRSGKENVLAKSSLRREANIANAVAAGKPVAVKHKTKGRDKPSKRHRKKFTNVITATRAKIAEQSAAKAKASQEKPVSEDNDSIPRALARFKRKGWALYCKPMSEGSEKSLVACVNESDQQIDDVITRDDQLPFLLGLILGYVVAVQFLLVEFYNYSCFSVGNWKGKNWVIFAVGNLVFGGLLLG